MSNVGHSGMSVFKHYCLIKQPINGLLIKKMFFFNIFSIPTGIPATITIVCVQTHRHILILGPY